MPERLLSSEEVCAKLSCGRSTLVKLRKGRGFPKPKLLGQRKLRWRESDIDKWIKSRKEQP